MDAAQETGWGDFGLGKRPVDEDRRLLGRVARGDERALEEIYARFGGPLFGYLRTLLPDRRLAEEALQDTLVAAWRSAGAFEGRSSVKTWLFGVARRRAHDVLRRRSPRLAAEAELEKLPTSDPDPETAVLAYARREELAERIARLSPPHREVLALVFFHELSYGETAQVLGVPIGTVKSRLSNAKKALRALLQAPEERAR